LTKTDVFGTLRLEISMNREKVLVWIKTLESEKYTQIDLIKRKNLSKK